MGIGIISKSRKTFPVLDITYLNNSMRNFHNIGSDEKYFQYSNPQSMSFILFYQADGMKSDKGRSSNMEFVFIAIGGILT